MPMGLSRWFPRICTTKTAMFSASRIPECQTASDQSATNDSWRLRTLSGENISNDCRAKDRRVSTSFDGDVFLSHSSVDKPRVARLAERLERAGFRVWFDRPNIDSGEDIVTAIEQGLERSRVLVLCMTKAAFESEWVRLERNTATFRDPANHDRRFLPLRLDDCQIPARCGDGVSRLPAVLCLQPYRHDDFARQP